MAGSRILVAEYPSKPGGSGIWYILPNGIKQIAFPKAELELEAFFKSQNLDIEIQVNDGAEFERFIWTEEDFTTLSLAAAA